jgi:tetratricopeptide (TPR) repeat protein
MAMMNRSSLIAIVASCAVAIMAADARAQDAPSPSDAPSSAPTKEALEEARTRYERGTQLYAEGEYKLALIEFQRANELAPSYKLLFNIGQVNLQIGNYAAALRAFERYLKEGGNQIPAKRRAQVEKEIPGLKGRTAHITVKVSVDGADVTLDGASIGSSPMNEPVLVNAGQHTVAARKAGRIAASKDVTLAGSDDVKIEFDLPEEPSAAVPVGTPGTIREHETIIHQAPEKPSYVWIGWVMTGALAAGAIGSGIAAMGAASDLKSAREQPAEAGESAEAKRTQLDDDRNKTRTLAITADVLAGAAIVVGAVSLVFTVKGSGKSEKRGQASPVLVGVGNRSISMVGHF